MDTSNPGLSADTAPLDFIREIIVSDRAAGKHGGRVHTRFPPEPNGYLHIGHAKAICLNFGVAEEFGGPLQPADGRHQPDEGRDRVRRVDQRRTSRGSASTGGRRAVLRLRLLRADVRLRRAAHSDGQGVRRRSHRRRRSASTAARSPSRAATARTATRSAEENLDLFRRMKAGEFPDGARVLRAKIDMASPNINMRDPVLYRIRHASHHRTGDAWCIYPMYDYAHPIEDAIEGITHSLCTLEFEDHRPLYDWVLETLRTPFHPQQIEFARLNLTYTVMSKRKLLQLVQERHVAGWDDPRMPTISGLRRRGYTPEAIRDFCERIGVAKKRTRHRRRAARALRARGSQQTGAARDGRAAAAEGGHRELPRGPGRADGGRQQPGGLRRPARARCRSHASSTSSRTTSARIRRRSSSGSRRDARSGCAMRT